MRVVSLQEGTSVASGEQTDQQLEGSAWEPPDWPHGTLTHFSLAAKRKGTVAAQKALSPSKVRPTICFPAPKETNQHDQRL
jgi:hypothetical protein